MACYSAPAPERERGESECGNTLLLGGHEQLVSREGLGLYLGRWETFWRTSGSAKAQTVLGVKAQNANPTPPVGLAWRIRIGNGHFGGDTKPCADLFASFQNGGLVGRNPVYLCPRLAPWSIDTAL